MQIWEFTNKTEECFEEIHNIKVDIFFSSDCTSNWSKCADEQFNFDSTSLFTLVPE